MSLNPASANPRVLVVGATGYLGAKVLGALKNTDGLALRAMSRRFRNATEDSSVEWVVGDMMSPKSLDAALDGVDIVVTLANGYGKESIEADFAGNKNLIDAAKKAGVKRFAFLSIVAAEHAVKVPHFQAKAVAEDLLKDSGLPFVIVRAPAFLDQEQDRIADMVRGGKIGVIGDLETRWSYVLTDELAVYLAKAVTYPTDDINFQTIDVGWSDGPMNQRQMGEIISDVTQKKLKQNRLPWWLLQALVWPAKLFSTRLHDMLQMFLFLRTGLYVSDLANFETFFGPAPTAKESIRKWALSKNLIVA